MKTLKITKVLIALDFDPSAKTVAEAGFSFAKKMGAEVILMHVLSDPTHYSSKKHIRIMGFAGQEETVQLELDSIDGLKKSAQLFLDKLKFHLGDKTIQPLVKEGYLMESILKVAKDLHANVIVMGSSSQQGLEKTATGSVTEKVLHHTSIPLFIIPIKQIK